MTTVLLIARLLLAAVFAVAGLAKLADPSGSRRAMRDFGVPPGLAAPLGMVLPLAELAVAVALIPRSSAWWGALGALGLLLLFVGGIGYNLARGRRPDCHCFGQLHSSPAGWSTLARNAILAAVATVVVIQGRHDTGPSGIAWLGDLSTAERVSLAVSLVVLGLLLAEGWALIRLFGQNGRLLVRLDALEAALTVAESDPRPAPAAVPTPSGPGLPVGTSAPDFALPGLFGETLTLDALRTAGKPVLLVFSHPNCGPCNALLPDLGRWQREDALTVAIVGEGTAEANRAKATQQGLTRVLLQQGREVAEAYQANGTPAAVIVRPDGTIGSPLALGVDAIRELVAKTAGAPAPALATRPTPAAATARVGVGGNGAASGAPVPAVTNPPVLGDPAPALALQDLDRRLVSLAAFRGRTTVVMFWNPGSASCQEVLPDLKAWESDPPKGAPKLLVVSTGGVEENRAMSLRSTVVLDPTVTTARAFGTTVTPSAVLVDTEGNIASPVVVDKPSLLALLNRQVPKPARRPATSRAGTANDGPAVGAPTTEAVPASSAAAKPKVGDPAPAVVLPNLRGETVNLDDFKGSPTAVLFWNPGCGFCNRILPDLKAWEANPPKGAPKLLVVSIGTVEANREMGLRSPVVLAPNFATARAFGTTVTPSAVLLDAEGRIASPVVAGAPSVFGLAGAGQDRPKPASA